jgi:histidinol phosphatase-like enzyme (inositol monophosphatase family)
MSAESRDPLQERLDWAVEIARQAGQLTLEYFRRPSLQVERKADDSPVTVADREAEGLLRRRIAERFAGDGILGEELGVQAGGSGYQWVLDPIDGTKSFIHGVPLYTTLVAVLEGETPCIGVIHAPALGETVYAAAGRGCWYVSGGHSAIPPQRAGVSEVARLREGLLLTSEIASFADERQPDALDVYLDLQRSARLARTWGDGYGYLMVATGRAEVMIDPAMKLWDAAPLQTIIEEAGGRFTDWQGRPTVHSGDAVATNGLVAGEVLAITKGR